MLGLLAGLLSCAAVAGDDPAHENRRVRAGDYKALHRSWWFDAQFGDAEKQEQLADLFPGPHGREAGAPRHEGVRFLFRAAVAGRPAAMLHLADALGKGAFGLRKLPAAARCPLPSTPSADLPVGASFVRDPETGAFVPLSD
jgi:hypothetical protein